MNLGLLCVVPSIVYGDFVSDSYFMILLCMSFLVF